MGGIRGTKEVIEKILCAAVSRMMFGGFPNSLYQCITLLLSSERDCHGLARSRVEQEARIVHPGMNHEFDYKTSYKKGKEGKEVARSAKKEELLYAKPPPNHMTLRSTLHVAAWRYR